MFGFQLAHGNSNILFDNDGIVVTESVARKYFDETNVLGETLTLQTNSGDRISYEITAVLKDIKSNSVVNFSNSPVKNEIFLPIGSLKHFMSGADEDWSFKYMVSIIKLSEGIAFSDFEENLNRLIASHAPEFGNKVACELKPLRDYYQEWDDGKVLKLVSSLSMVAFFILFLVLTNFISMMIAGSSHRLREIGLRKLFGGIRRQLIFQFLSESILISLLSLVLAIVLYVMVRVPFQELLGKAPSVYQFPISVFLTTILLAIAAGIIAGIYPAFRLSNFKIVSAVKGKLPAFGEGRFLRKTLLCFQISVASFVLISSIYIAKQLAFIQRFDLGFDKDNIMVITSLPREWNEKGLSNMEAIKTGLLNRNDVIDASVSYEVPDGNAGNRYEFRSGDGRLVDMPLLNVDENFAATYNLELVAGTFFHADKGEYQKDRVVLSETAARSFGWTPEQAIGNSIFAGENTDPLTVSGVVRDFHFYSLFKSVEPISMIHIRDKFGYRYLSLRIKSENMSGTIKGLESQWTDLFPEAPFDYIFMDDKVKQFYTVEDRMHKSSRIASIITLFIMVCGIIAFMSVSLARRVKEIGIRRVHGATSLNILILLLNEFFWQYVLAGIIACGLAYYFLTSWLAGFQYKITLSFAPFVITYISLVLFVCLLITIYSLRIVLMNPVRSLRYE
jgi:putative ABC transport system permease protein